MPSTFLVLPMASRVLFYCCGASLAVLISRLLKKFFYDKLSAFWKTSSSSWLWSWAWWSDTWLVCFVLASEVRSPLCLVTCICILCCLAICLLEYMFLSQSDFELSSSSSFDAYLLSPLYISLVYWSNYSLLPSLFSFGVSLLSSLFFWSGLSVLTYLSDLREACINLELTFMESFY